MVRAYVDCYPTVCSDNASETQRAWEMRGIGRLLRKLGSIRVWPAGPVTRDHDKVKAVARA